MNDFQYIYIKNNIIFDTRYNESIDLNFDKFQESGEEILVHFKNESCNMNKSFLESFQSNFINQQMENSSEVFIPIFNRQDFSHFNLEILNYLDSKIFEKCVLRLKVEEILKKKTEIFVHFSYD